MAVDGVGPFAENVLNPGGLGVSVVGVHLCEQILAKLDRFHRAASSIPTMLVSIPKQMTTGSRTRITLMNPRLRLIPLADNLR